MDPDALLSKWALSIYKEPLTNEDIVNMQNWAESHIVNPNLYKSKYNSSKYYYSIVAVVSVLTFLIYITYKPQIIETNTHVSDEVEIENNEDGEPIEVEEVVSD